MIVRAVKVLWMMTWMWLSTLWTRVVFRANGISFGKGLKAIGIPHVNVSLGGKAKVGDVLYVRSGVGPTEVGIAGTRVRVGKNGSLEIGDRVGMSNVSIFCQQSVKIGNDTFIGGGVQIFDSDMHSTIAAVRAADPTAGAKTAPVVIGPMVFIGTNAIICKGVNIGAKSTIGAGSVVSRSVPEGETWAGNPARKVR